MSLTKKQAQLLESPIRVDILKLFAEDPERSLAPSDIAAALPDETSPAQVDYHLRRLQEAGWVRRV
ncbi:MAG: helix-turn-helix domain-containing protein [Solirubrobacterales bacterium]